MFIINNEIFPQTEKAFISSGVMVMKLKTDHTWRATAAFKFE
jgi:hypothetical protein